jgi:hypothetical protein
VPRRGMARFLVFALVLREGKARAPLIFVEEVCDTNKQDTN